MITVIAADAVEYVRPSEFVKSSESFGLTNRISSIPYIVIIILFIAITVYLIKKEVKESKIVKKCGNCGITVKGKYCPNCGERITNDSKENYKKIVKHRLRIVSIIIVFGIISNIVLMVVTFSQGYLEMTAGSTVKMTNADVGDIVEYGKYEQDGKMDNGPESIEWYVLKKITNDSGEDMLLLLSKYILAKRSYNDEDKYVIWDDCTLRGWLNDDFYKEAFNNEEQNRIVLTNNKNYYWNRDESDYSVMNVMTDDFSLTDDRIFLMSLEDYRDMNEDIKDAFVYTSRNAMSEYERSSYSLLPNLKYCILPWFLSLAYMDAFIEGYTRHSWDSSNWWLRSNYDRESAYRSFDDREPGCACYAYCNPEYLPAFSLSVEIESGVRPAMWVYVK